MKSTDINAVDTVSSMAKWRDTPWATLVVLAIGFFLTMLDLTIINIAIPSIVENLDTSLNDVLWGVNAYVLVLTVLLITTGRLGDAYGPRRMFIIGISLFTLFSLACGLVRTPTQLIVARALQGLGSAFILPQTMTMIVRIFPANQRGTALGIWGAVGGLAAVAGPALGGFLVSTLGWRSIFMINVPMGLLALGLTVLIVPNLRPGQCHRLDISGVLIASLSLFCLTFALLEGQRYVWGGEIQAILGAAAVFATIFVIQQWRRQHRDPLVPFALFSDRNYTLMNLVTMMISLGIIALMLLLSIFFQTILGFSALDAGLAIAPASLVSMLLAPFSGRLADKIDGKYLLFTGLLLSAAGMLWIKSIMYEGTGWSMFILPMVVIGTGNGLMIAPMAAVAMRGVRPELAGAASGVMNTVRQVGSVMAVAAVGALIQYQLAAVSSSSTAAEAAESSAQAYALAVHTAMFLPVTAMLIGAAACVAAKRVQ